MAQGTGGAGGAARIPEAGVREEALALMTAAAQQGILLRVLGGAAVAIRCPSSAQPPLARAYKDVDLAGTDRQNRQIQNFLRSMGYRGDDQFNALQGSERLLFWDDTNGRQLDVFLDKIKMCHQLPLRDRLAVDDITLAPVDLLLTKLQVVQTNERDLKDSAALILDCEIDADRLAKLLGSDWGWWRTATEVLGKVDAYVAAQVDFARRDEARAKIARLRQSIDAQPKSMGWRARARIGDRIRWYELPEEDYQ
jgi:hypothetical protein